MSRYTIALFDIDGVLNEHGANIMPESVEAINRLRLLGIRPCFASGKQAIYIMGGLVFSGLLSPETVIIGENGGVVFRPADKKTVYPAGAPLAIETIRRIFRSRCRQQEGFTYFNGNEVWEEPKETLLTIYPRQPRVYPVQDLAQELQAILRAASLDSSLYISEHVDAIDVLPQGLNKSVGLKVLAEWLGAAPEEIIGFGDDYNDREMLAVVGLPVAVANARPEIRELVRSRGGYVCQNRCGQGVLEAVDMLQRTGLI